MPIKTKPFDPTRYLQTPEARAHLISDALSTGHAGYIADAVGTIARMYGMSKLAEKTGLSRQALYVALSKDGNPSLDTLLKVIHALGLDLSVHPSQKAEAA